MALDNNETVLCSVPVIHVPFLDLLGPAQRAGFSALSITPTHLAGLQQAGVTAADLRRRLADQGLRIAEFECITHWLPGQAERARHVPDYGVQLLDMTADAILPMAEAVGARSVAVVEMFGVAVDVDVAAEAFAGLCDRAREHGLNVNIEFLPAGGLRDLATAAEIVRRAGRANGGITFDTLHFWRSGSTLEELRRLPADSIGMVQLADGTAAPEMPIDIEMVTARLVPGAGALDVRSVVEALDALGVTAPVGVEVFSEAVLSDPPDKTAHSWMAALRKVTGRA